MLIVSLYLRPPPHLSILAFNKLVYRAYKNHDTTARSYFVYGYYITGRNPMLIPDLALLRRNTSLPDSLCVLLRGAGVDSIRNLGLADRYENALVEV